MRRSAFTARGLRGGVFPPAKPTISYVSTGVFKVTDYDSKFTYTPTVTAGTATKSYDTDGKLLITLSSTDTVCTLTPSFGPVG